MNGDEYQHHHKKDELPDQGCDVPGWTLIPFFLGCAGIIIALMAFGSWLGGRL